MDQSATTVPQQCEELYHKNKAIDGQEYETKWVGLKDF